MKKKIILILLSPLLILIMVEVMLRGYFYLFGTEIDRIMYVYSVDEIKERNNAFMGIPFVGYGPSPAHPEHNQLGFRNREITIEKPEGTYRIVAVGGSTTYGFRVEPDESWSAQLETILHEDYGVTQVEVINTGVMGYTTWNSLANLAFRVLDLSPDLVIVYHGTNDAKVRWIHPNCFSGQTPIGGLARGIWKENGPDLSPLSIYRYVGIGRGWIDNPIELNSWIYPVTASDPDCFGDEPMASPDYLQMNSSDYFERNLRNIVHLASANDADVLLSTWAYYPDFVEESLIPVYEEQNQIIEAITDDLGVYYVDFMGQLPHDEQYWFADGEHQNSEGYYQQAAFYADYIADRIFSTALRDTSDTD